MYRFERFFSSKLDLKFDFFHTLPSSTATFSTANQFTSQVNNGSYQAATTSSYGSYYSGSAVTANTVTASSRGSITYNICSKNWTLPTQAQYITLIGKFTNRDAFNAAWCPSYADYIVGTLYHYETSAQLRSSTISTSGRMYVLSNGKNGTLNATDAHNNYDGVPSRCVAK